MNIKEKKKTKDMRKNIEIFFLVFYFPCLNQSKESEYIQVIHYLVK